MSDDKETWSEQEERIEAMIADTNNETWYLSNKDREAIKALFEAWLNSY